jgi:BirA family biotin operon repressor/biotin-[acetyl-CoA-carboxylase] ligase
MNSIHLDTIDSTNTYAKLHASHFPTDQITCISAEEQTVGRGRYERRWISPRGVNLYATFFFQLSSHTPHLISLGQVMAASFATVLLKEGFFPKIKWPNDVQLQGKKVSGILCETSFHPPFVDVFLGIGVNVNMKADDLVQIDQPATSLKEETGHVWDKKTLLRKLQQQFASDLENFKREGFLPFYQLFDSLLALKGKKITCFDGQKTWVGTCHSLTEEGQLNLLLLDHSLHTISSGDISSIS